MSKRCYSLFSLVGLSPMCLLEQLQFLFVPIRGLRAVLPCGLVVVTIGDRQLLVLLHRSEGPDALDRPEPRVDVSAQTESTKMNSFIPDMRWSSGQFTFDSWRIFKLLLNHCSWQAFQIEKGFPWIMSDLVTQYMRRTDWHLHLPGKSHWVFSRANFRYIAWILIDLCIWFTKQIWEDKGGMLVLKKIHWTT